MTPIDVRPRHETLVEDTAALLRRLPIEPGRVRSKRLFASDNLTVLGVAMDAGSEMREHVAPAPILIHVVSGEAVLDIGGRRVALLEGTLVHVDAREPHAVEALAPTRFLLVLVKSAAETASVAA